MRDLVAVTALQSFLDPRRIDFDAEKNRAIHGRGERLGAAHSAKSAGQDKFSFKRATKMFSSRRGESFKRSLNDSLTANVNPRTGRHLSVHRQTKPLEPIEFRIVRPIANQI